MMNTPKRKELVNRLQEARKQRDFYAQLYNQYTVDLLKMTLYVRKVITTPEISAYLAEHHAQTLRDLTEIVMDVPAPASLG